MSGIDTSGNKQFSISKNKFEGWEIIRSPPWLYNCINTWIQLSFQRDKPMSITSTQSMSCIMYVIKFISQNILLVP